MSTETTPTPTPTPATINDLTITDGARAKVLAVMEQEELAADERNLRLFVAGGGCGGPAFGLAFDKAEDGDTSVKVGDLSVIVDPQSLPYVHGATVDYVETAEVQGFKVSVPRPEGGSCNSGACGDGQCGEGSGAPDDGHQHGGGGGCGSGGCC